MFDVIEIVPLYPIDRFCYFCDSKFHTEPIETLFEDATEKFGIVIVMGEEATFFSIDEYSRYKKLGKVCKKIPNNHRRGGQSQARIGRLRDEHIHRYITMVNEGCIKYFTKQGNSTIKKLIISGPAQKKEKISFKHTEIILLNYDNIDSVLVEFKNILDQEQKKDANFYISEIEEIMRINPDLLVFGNEVDLYLKNNELKKVWSKTSINSAIENVVFDHYYLDNFQGRIGLKWF